MGVVVWPMVNYEADDALASAAAKAAKDDRVRQVLICTPDKGRYWSMNLRFTTTLEIYTVPIPAHRRAAVENLARLVTNGDALEQCARKLPETTQQIQ